MEETEDIVQACTLCRDKVGEREGRDEKCCPDDSTDAQGQWHTKGAASKVTHKTEARQQGDT